MDGSYSVRLNDFVVGDTSANPDADILDISDLLRGAINAAGDPGNVLSDGELTAAEVTSFFHFVDHPFAAQGNSYMMIDLQGGFNDTTRAALPGAAGWGAIDGLSDLVVRVRNGAGTNQDFSQVGDMSPFSTTDAGTQAMLENLINLGFLEIN